MLREMNIDLVLLGDFLAETTEGRNQTHKVQPAGMELMRKRPHVRGHLLRLFQQLQCPGPVLSLRHGKVLLQLRKLNALNCQALAEVVVKLTRDAGAFFLLSVNQVAAQPPEVRRCSLLSGTLPQ